MSRASRGKRDGNGAGAAAKVSWTPLIAASVAQFVMVVDTSMMAVAVPAITKELGTTVGHVQFAIALYPLITGALMLTGGKVGSLLGARRAFLISSFVFGIGAVISVFAINVTMLTLGWAVVEGLGAAVLNPLLYVLIIRTYSGRQRVTGFGVLSGVGATASAVGPIIGGFFTTYLTWRLGFGLQVVGILLAIAIVFFAKSGEEKEDAPDEEAVSKDDIDWMGTLLSALGFTLVTIGVILAPQYGWWDTRRPFTLGELTLNPFGLSPVPFLVLIGLICFVLFLHWSKRRIKAGKEALLRPELLSIRQFRLGITVEGIANMTFDGLMFMMPLFFQIAVGLTAFTTGLALLPISISMLSISLLVSQLTRRWSSKALVQAGLGILIAGLIWFWSVIQPGMTASSSIGAFLLIGLGAGAVIALMSAITLGAVPRDASGEASSVSRANMRIARSLGTAVIGSAFLSMSYGNIVDGVLKETNTRVTPEQRNQLVVELEDTMATQEQSLREAISALPAEVQEGLRQIVDGAVFGSAQDTILIAAAVIVFALLVSTFLKRPEDVTPEEPEAEAEAAAA